MSTEILKLIEEKRVIVCCGAGGVGKTSVAASMGVGAARLGRRVLVVTIDPSKRLAETLGVDRNPASPVKLPEERLKSAGIKPPGSLEAWMLDPQVVSSNVVKRFSKDGKTASDLLSNRIFKNVTAMVAGMQEYTAVQAMYEFVNEDRYDLVILDTPPSRNALHFLEAPSRITRFLDGRVFRYFLPGDDSFLKKATSKVLNKVMDIAFGTETRVELLNFFAMFSSILLRLNRNAGEMREFFQKDSVSFLVITSPAQEALDEARYFEKKTRDELSLPLSGYILNRSLAFVDGKLFPDETLFDSKISTKVQEELQKFAVRERREAEAHTSLMDEIRSRLKDGFVEALPYLIEGVADMKSLVTLIDSQVQST